MVIRSFFLCERDLLGVDFLGSPQAALRKTDPARGGGKARFARHPKTKALRAGIEGNTQRQTAPRGGMGDKRGEGGRGGDKRGEGGR